MRTKGLKKLLKALIPASVIRYRGRAEQNQVALTFDDGPVPGITDHLIRSLSARGHRATFFVVGRRAELNPALLHSIADSGCEVANHSYSHPRFSEISYAQVAEEVRRTDQVLANTVPSPSWFRPPGGRLSWRLFLYLWRRGAKASPVLWSVSIPHEHRKTHKEIVDLLRQSTPSAGDIVLLHDDHPTIVEAIPAILDLLDECGLRSVPVSELL